eukprot:TRINITY_DN77192_c0_g1_i1.p1 TRINITY_DN77192_c0_g1~~TRINITY_DN77192_c0_g1_i1.p1  ORF type:complete len:192 (-),score=53.77 TRINITY_DN77192_c0_g1_i1:98-673(-)
MMGSSAEESERKLDSLETLINEMKRLEAEVNAKRDEQEFLDQLIADKKATCKKLKDDHDEKIKLITRQARKSRAKKESGSMQKHLQAVNVAKAAEAADAQKEASRTLLDSNLLDRALGPNSWQNLKKGPEGETDRSLNPLISALNERLDLARLLKQQVATLVGKSGPELDAAVQGLEADVQEVLSVSGRKC